MKYRYFILLVLIFTIAFPAFCSSEQQIGEAMIPIEWKWNPGAINTISGEVDLSSFYGKILNICLMTDLPSDEESEQDNKPVFVSINGKRIPVLKQSDKVQFIPDSNKAIFSYTSRITLPKKHRVREVCFTLQISDEDGKTLKNIQSYVNYHDMSSERSEGSFYIPYDIGKITIILTVIASVVWIAVFCRDITIRKKNQNGEK